MNTWTAKAHQLRQAQADILATILNEMDEDDIPPSYRNRYRTTAAGDEKKLRGIPVQAPGISSTIPGTNPLNALLSKQPND